MARLGGQFAGILRIEVPAEREAAVAAALAGLAAQGLKVLVHADRGIPVTSPARHHSLEVVRHDRPGIVRQISGALAAQGVNVEAFESECVSAAMSGEPLFRARALLAVPEGCALETLRQHLEGIASDLIVDISFKDAPAETVRNLPVG